ncbi:hypothetical protein ABBQ38_011789 [Trebouxia sp. C0009 RCD-2024]
MQRSAALFSCSQTVLQTRAQQSCLQHLRHRTDGTTQQTRPATAAEQAAAAEDSTPPSAARAVATMGAGALGAVAVAAVGVWGVFKMAMAVAEGTGRTLNSNGGAPPAVTNAGASKASGLLPMQPAVPSGPVYPPSPQHRKADLQADLQAMYQMPRSPAVEEQMAAIRQELHSLR